MSDPPPEVKILLLGDDSCGKSTFLSRISLGHNPHTNTPLPQLPLLHDIDQPFTINVTYFNRPYLFKIYDCDGPGEWRLLRPDVVVLCFDIGVRGGLEGLKERWHPDVLSTIFTEPHFITNREPPLLVLGLKRDVRNIASSPSLRPSPSPDTNSSISPSSSQTQLLPEEESNGEGEDKFIIPQEGHRYAMEMRADGYMECSALMGELVWEVWEDLVRCGVGVVNGGGKGGWGACGVM